MNQSMNQSMNESMNELGLMCTFVTHDSFTLSDCNLNCAPGTGFDWAGYLSSRFHIYRVRSALLCKAKKNSNRLKAARVDSCCILALYSSMIFFPYLNNNGKPVGIWPAHLVLW